MLTSTTRLGVWRIKLGVDAQMHTSVLRTEVVHGVSHLRPAARLPTAHVWLRY